MNRKTLGAQQDGAHVVHGVCGMKTEGTEVVKGPVGTRLCLQAVKDLVRMYLLNVQGAHRALQRVVVRVSVRPSKAVLNIVYLATSSNQNICQKYFLS